MIVFAGSWLVQGCGTNDAKAVTGFADEYKRTVEAQENTIAASYPYQLSETPESRPIRQAFERIRTRSWSAADLEEALTAERELGWYIDHFEGEVESLRMRTAELSAPANSIRDEEIRAAAVNVGEQFFAVLINVERLVSAQRDNSTHVSNFLTSLLRRDRSFPPRAELEATSSRLSQLRESMLRMMNLHQVAFEKFKDIVGKRLGMKL